MKLSASLFVAAAVSAAVALGSNAWAQTIPESETIMTAPLTRSVTTRTVTTRTLVNPPAAVIVNPPAAVIVNQPPPVVINRAPLLSTKTTTTTTESTATEDEDGAPVLGKAVDGNTTIVFDGADTRDIHMNRLRTWDEFAQAHPGIANTLAYKPWLINDPDYLARHPALDAFFQAHPSIKIAMAENPGTFAAIPPRPGE
jgi:hypothetical protein